MLEKSDRDSRNFERYRDYLRFLAQAGLDPRLRARVEASDIVQETLIEAHQAAGRFHGETPGEELAWLRKILARNLANAGRDHRRQCRDVRREQALEAGLERSSVRLEAVLVADDTSPSEGAARSERVLRLAAGIASLPDDERDAFLLHHWHDWTLQAIAAHLQVSRFVVARLLRGAVESLRRHLKELDES